MKMVLDWLVFWVQEKKKVVSSPVAELEIPQDKKLLKQVFPQTGLTRQQH
jgi:hypothetical protein